MDKLGNGTRAPELVASAADDRSKVEEPATAAVPQVPPVPLVTGSPGASSNDASFEPVESDDSELVFDALSGALAAESSDDDVVETPASDGLDALNDAHEGNDNDVYAQLDELVLALEDSLDISPDDTRERVSVSSEFSQEVVEFLVMSGTLLFISKYVLPGEHSVETLLSALGFPLVKGTLDGVDERSTHLLLQVAIRHAKKSRRRLPAPRTLDEVAAAIIKSQNIIVVSGAGISTSLGIPDFRSDDGLYAQLAHLGLQDPQEVFDIRTFRLDPAIFYSVARKILPESAQSRGTPTHQFIKLLADKGKLLRNYTQNIDNLEAAVGVPREKLVQCHGSFGSAHCITCSYEVKDGTALYPQIRAGEIPRCPECQFRQSRGKRSRSGESDDEDPEDASFGVIKPDITFFGESLPSLFDQRLFDDGDARKCDLLLCLGTSLRVSPVCEIVQVVGRDVPQVCVSKARVNHLTFEAEFIGSSDDTVELLAQKLGWDLDHPMARRTMDMPETEFPGGTIESFDGRFTFVES